MQNKFYIAYLIAALVLVLISSVFYQSSLDFETEQGFKVINVSVIGMLGALILTLCCFIIKAQHKKTAETIKFQQFHLFLTLLSFIILVIFSGRPSIIFVDDAAIFRKIKIVSIIGLTIFFMSQSLLYFIFKNAKKH